MIADKLSSFLRHIENGVGEKADRLPHHLWYDDLLELAGIGLWFVSPRGETTYVNNTMAVRLGYTPEEVMSLPLVTFTSEEVMADGVRYMQRRRQGIAETLETKLLHRDGTEIPIFLSSVPMFSKTGEFLGAACVLMDVTEAKKSEQALGESEKRYRTILETILDGYYECDLAGHLTYCNAAFCRIYGLSGDDYLGTHCRDFTTLETRQRIFDAFNCVYATGEPIPSFEFELIRRDGVIRFVEGSIGLICDMQGKATGFRGIIRDTTERQKAEDQIRRLEERFRTIANSAPVMIWMSDADKACSFFNQCWLDFTGRTLEQEAGDGWIENLHPDDLAQTLDICDSAFCSRVPFKMEFRLRRHDGVYRWILDEGVPRYMPNGEFVGFIGASIDITERKETEEALHQSEERYRTILENIHDGYYETDLAGRLTFVNDGLVKMLGFESKEKLLGLNMRRFADEKHAHRLREIGNLIYCTGKPVPSFEYQIKHADGARYNVDISISLIKDSTGQPTGYRGILRDVTVRKQTEKLIQSQMKVLEMIATGAPLKEALETLVRLVEGLSKNTTCSILLLDEAGQRLSHGAALNLPEEYVHAIDGVAIGPCVGSCGTAAYTGQTVVVTDIAQDPLWADYRDLALKHGLRACWSVPIFSTTRQVLGTFACYYQTKAEPTLAEMNLIGAMAHLASIAIERARIEQKLLASEARFRALTERSGEGISLLALDGRITYTSPVMKTILGYEVDEVVGNPANDRIHPDDTSSLRQLLESLSKQPGQSAVTAYRTRHKNGSWQWIESTFTNLLDEPNVRAIVVNFRDITERKKAEDALRTSEERFAKAFDFNPNPMVILTYPESRFAQVNQSWLNQYGYTAQEVIGFTALEINHLVPNEFERLNEPGGKRDLEVRLLTKNGEERIAVISCDLVEFGGVPYLLGSSNDITERKQAEDALRASEERFAKAFNASPQPMAILELPSRKYTNVNRALVRSSGRAMEEIVGRTSGELNIWVNPEDSQRVAEMLAQQGFVSNLETQFRTKSGEVRDFLYSAEQIIFNGQPHILVVANDITERKRAEEASRQNEVLLRSVIESNPDWIFVKDRHHRYKLVNQTYAKSLHRGTQDFIDKNDLEMGFPEYLVKGDIEKGIRGFWADDREVFETGQLKFIEEEPVEIDGQIHLFNTFKVPLFASDGSVWGVLGVGRDITKLRHAEAALRASEERFAKAFNASPQPMAIFEAPGRRIVSVNEAMVRTFGWTAEEMISHTPGDLNIWVDMEQQRNVRALLASQGFVRNLEIKFRTKPGEVREFLYSAETINLKNHPHVLVVANDITERKRVERALQESEERYRLLFEHGFAGILRSTSSGQVIDCNDALAHMFGCESREELLQHNGEDSDFDVVERQQGIEELRVVDSLRNVERLLKRKDGSPVWTLSNYTVHQRGQDGTLVWDSVVLDITERKQIEQELVQSHEQLRSLSARLEQVREEERTRIAREIHDNLGQALTGLKMDFSWLDKNLARVKDEDLRRKTGPKLKEIAELLEETIQTVRNIATELRPGVLDTLGLSAAIDWQSRAFARRSGIKCRVNVCREPQGIPVEQSTALFRVFQEILTNIARHAQAKHFSVKVADAGSDLTLIVQDDGIGITEEQLRNPTSLGLIGMRERVLGFGGSVRIEGCQHQGTTVIVSLPMGE